MSRPCLILLSLSLAACASQLAERREAPGDPSNPKASPSDEGAPEEAEVRARVAALLRAELTEQSAVQLALLNNRELQAAGEELGVAQADLVQAGLLRNPSFGVAVRFPETSGGILNTEFSLAQELLDLFLLPLRKRLADEQLQQAKLRLSNTLFLLVGRVRREFYALQALQQAVALRRDVLEAAEASAELAARQRQAGNIGELELDTQRSATEQARLDLARDALELEGQRERLNRLLGLWGTQTGWTVTAMLPDLPPAEPSLEGLEARAVERRLDVASARQEARIVTQALELAKTSRFVGMVEVGVSRSSGPEPGIRVTGPTLRLELPIFDRRQGLIGKLEAQRRQSEKRLQALAVDARSEVRIAVHALRGRRQVAEQFRSVLLPLRERIVARAQERYNGMLLGVFQLLLARQSEIESYRQFLEVVRDYWVAHVELERAVGGSLSDAPAPAPAPAPPASGQPASHQESAP